MAYTIPSSTPTHAHPQPSTTTTTFLLSSPLSMEIPAISITIAAGSESHHDPPPPYSPRREDVQHHGGPTPSTPSFVPDIKLVARGSLGVDEKDSANKTVTSMFKSFCDRRTGAPAPSPLRAQHPRKSRSVDLRKEVTIKVQEERWNSMLKLQPVHEIPPPPPVQTVTKAAPLTSIQEERRGALHGDLALAGRPALAPALPRRRVTGGPPPAVPSHGCPSLGDITARYAPARTSSPAVVRRCVSAGRLTMPVRSAAPVTSLVSRPIVPLALPKGASEGRKRQCGSDMMAKLGQRRVSSTH